MSSQDIVNEIIKESCVALFGDYSLALSPADPKEFTGSDGLLYCGVLGFTGDQMRGVLLLATTQEPLGRTSPTSDASLRGWIAELSNQLLGRVKNQLLRRGVTIHLSTPVVLRGQHLAPLPSVEIVPFAFKSEGGMVCVWFDSELVDGVEIATEAAPDESVSEGTGFFF